MNIKSILLGSAAALVAVSGARAADAVVVAEPEPVEYVRVCDIYGAGFFYIPGTETCLQISGEVRYQIVVGDNQWPAEFDNQRDGEGWTKYAKGRVNFDARSETEWGTLRGFIRFDSEWTGYNTVDGGVVVDHAIIELGGLRMGYTESAWAQTQYGGASNWGGHSDTGLSYGYQQRDLIAYSFQGGNGLFGTLSLEEDEGGNFVPDVVAVLGMNQGWGAAWAKGAYDETAGEFSASLGVHVNIPNMAGSSLRIIGFYASGINDFGVGPYYFPASTSEFSVLASYQHQVNEKLAVIVGGQYFNNIYQAMGADGWQVEGSIVWTPVTNFEVRAEVSHARVDGFDGRTGGWLRFTRYF